MVEAHFPYLWAHFTHLSPLILKSVMSSTSFDSINLCYIDWGRNYPRFATSIFLAPLNKKYHVAFIFLTSVLDLTKIFGCIILGVWNIGYWIIKPERENLIWLVDVAIGCDWDESTCDCWYSGDVNQTKNNNKLSGWYHCKQPKNHIVYLYTN